MPMRLLFDRKTWRELSKKRLMVMMMSRGEPKVLALVVSSAQVVLWRKVVRFWAG